MVKGLVHVGLACHEGRCCWPQNAPSFTPTEVAVLAWDAFNIQAHCMARCRALYLHHSSTFVHARLNIDQDVTGIRHPRRVNMQATYSVMRRAPEGLSPRE
jgi:hypothetical protein